MQFTLLNSNICNFIYFIE